MAALRPKLDGLARILVSYDLLDEDLAKKAALAAKQEKTPFIAYIVRERIIDSLVIATSIADDFGLPLLDLEQYHVDYLPKKIVSDKLIHKHHAIPIFKRGNQLFLALSDPTNQAALDEIKFNTGLNTRSILVEEHKLDLFINKILGGDVSALAELTDSELDELNIDVNTDEPVQDDGEASVDDAPIVRFINKLLLDAIKQGVSDIHFEPYEKSFRVRFRQDGLLHSSAEPPVTLGARIASRLKVMSQLDISERRVPQDGRFKMKISPERAIDFRVSTCPTVGGEKVVMRILDPTSAKLGIDHLGYFEKQKDAFVNAIHKPQGMVLVTGPTGSGKTVSLYTALNILNTDERNISTAEDPVEIKLDGVNQVQVNTKTGLTFATALKSFLRQDPDIIMVGEIRDLETAEIAIKASQTGHLVLSTLHTNSAPETLTRLVNMGVANFNIATSVTLVIAQRLARRLCEACKKTSKLPIEVMQRQGLITDDTPSDFTICEAVGCESCTNGYKGRVGIYEVLPVSPEIADIIMRGGNSLDILKQAKIEGMLTLRDSGIIRVKEGLMSLSEFNRVTKDN